jgi:SAM-dependent methyltransferase
VSLQRTKQDWEELAAVDPLWAILSDPQRRYGRWELAEFFATGDTEIAEVLRVAQSLGVPNARGRALDFGCGVGRLTRALSARFACCWGIDIAEGMIERARRYNADRENCTFLVNVAPDLRLFETASFDFVYSSIVLQHMPDTATVRRYVAEFLRLVRPGGAVVFQMPYHIPWRNRWQLRRRLYALLRRLRVGERYLYDTLGLNPIRMLAMREAELRSFIVRCGGVVARVEPDSDPNGPIRGLRYYVHHQR